METSKGFQQQDQMHRIDWQKNSSITQSINGGLDIGGSGRRRRWSHWTSNLTTLTHDSTYISIVIDMLHIIIEN